MKHTLSEKQGERLVAVLTALLFLFAAAYAALRHYIRAPQVAPDPPPQRTVTTQLLDPSSAPADNSDSAELPAAQERKENCFTILVSGLDNDNGGSDTNILVCFNGQTRAISLVSLPRDTLLHHTWASNKLNFAYNKGGTALLQEEIANLLGIPVDFYVTVDLKGFVALVDQVGGIDFDVPVDMDYDDPEQNLHIHLRKGRQHLSGTQAMGVVRWRKNNDGSGYAAADIGRIGTQQAFLNTAAHQILGSIGVDDVAGLVSIFASYVKTDLTTGNLVWLGTQALDFGLDSVQYLTLPGDGSARYRGESVYALDPESTLALVNEALNPYVAPITREDMDILVP